MHSKQLSSALAILKRVREDPRMEQVHQERLRKAQRELEVLGRSGKMDKRRVSRAVKMLCDVLVDAARTTHPGPYREGPPSSGSSAENERRFQAQKR